MTEPRVSDARLKTGLEAILKVIDARNKENEKARALGITARIDVPYYQELLDRAEQHALGIAELLDIRVEDYADRRDRLLEGGRHDFER